MYNKDFMLEAFNSARFGSKHLVGGPFGATIVKDGKIVTTQHNSVLLTKDPTAHAEVNAIRSASLKLGTYDLSDCELYATGYPCPMCLGAIMWAGIKKVYVSGNLEDAEKIGFSDEKFYETIDNLRNSCYNINMDIEFVDRELAQTLYSEYEQQKGIIY